MQREKMIYKVHVTFDGELLDTIEIDTDDQNWNSASEKHSVSLDIYEAIQRHYLSFINENLLKKNN